MDSRGFIFKGEKIMENMMKVYLGNDYSDDYLKNFCLYWLKGMACRPSWENTEESRAAYDAWRKENDLDCLYYGGDLKADTLMSAWTPISWVVNLLNKGKGKVFYKTKADIRLLMENIDKYLPGDNELVRLLYRFLELAELPCNYILLPDRNMNTDRYCFRRSAKFRMLYDQVPATLWHVFEKETLGMYFLDENGEVDEEAVAAWILRERLEMGFKNKVVKQSEVLPLVEGLEPCDAKRFTTADEIKQALTYMINILEKRKAAVEPLAVMFLVPRENTMRLNGKGVLEKALPEGCWGVYGDGVVRRFEQAPWMSFNPITEWDRRFDNCILRIGEDGGCMEQSDEYRLYPLSTWNAVCEDLRKDLQDGVCTQYNSEWSKPRGDREFYHGNAYDLTGIYEFEEGCQAYLFEEFGTYKGLRFDLGMNRILETGFCPHLVLIRCGSISIHPIRYQNGEMIRLSDVLRELGIEHKTRGGMLLSVSQTEDTGWKELLHKTRAIFSACGYALQKTDWIGKFTYDFEINFAAEGHFKLDGRSVKKIFVSQASDSVMDAADELIYAVLSAPVNISGADLVSVIKGVGLGAELRKVRVVTDDSCDN